MAAALAEQTRIYQNFQPIFDRYDVLITPAVNVLPFPHQLSYPKTLDGRPARHYSEWYSITYGISLVGHSAVAIPYRSGSHKEHLSESRSWERVLAITVCSRLH